MYNSTFTIATPLKKHYMGYLQRYPWRVRIYVQKTWGGIKGVSHEK